MDNKIIWLDVAEFEGIYKVSEFGDVFSQVRNGTKGGLLKPSIDRYGYKKVTLNKNNKPYFFTIHRLVAIAFIPNEHGKKTVNHKDGNKLNNHHKNLEWATNEENMDHSFEIGKQKNPKQPIVAIDTKTGEEFIFPSHKEAGRKLKIDQGNISKVVRGEYNQANGFIFKRIEG